MPQRAGNKVLLAMSGGVDSSVAAALLLREGYDVIGCFMRLGSPGETLDTPLPDRSPTCDTRSLRIGKQGCCSVGDAADARAVAAQLDIPLYVVNFKKEFGRIIDYFEDEYRAGRTPNPCVRCNDWLKFGRLHEYAEQLGCDLVASGHYARVAEGPSGHELRQGVNADKDQSYVLFGVPRKRLAHMLLPIGEYETKSEVRALADGFGLPVFDKPDSQEICFVQGRQYTEFLEARDPELRRPGDLVDTAGNRLGTHDGHHRFTIGQRRGLGVAVGHPIFVVDKDPATNTVTIGTEDDLLCARVVAHEANWLAEPPQPNRSLACFARYRSNGSLVRARVRAHGDDGRRTASVPSGRAGAFEVTFDEPQRAVAPGQAIVLYSEDDPALVLGGGWIDSAPRTESSRE